MKEFFEFRVNPLFAEELFTKDEGADKTSFVNVIKIERKDPRFERIGVLQKKLLESKNDVFFYSWSIIHKYSKSEIAQTNLFQFKAKYIFEPAGEECGTRYDETVACKICGSNAKQRGYLKLKSGSIPKADISCTIAGEYVVSEKFVQLFNEYGFVGGTFLPVLTEKDKPTKYFQLKLDSPVLTLAKQTLAGITPFDFSEYQETAGTYNKGANYYTEPKKEFSICPLGHTLGLNLISLPFVDESSLIGKSDLFITSQNFGVRSGLLRPEPLYICSSRLRNMIIEEKMKGFLFDIVKIVE